MAVASVLSVGLMGCGTPPPPGPEPSPHAVGLYDPAWMPHRHELPPPQLDRLNFDERTRTLSLYPLPGNGRWMVQMPGEREGRLVLPQHRLPEADPAEVLVYYVQPGRRPSVPVTIKQIQESGSVHVSFVAQPR
ncbi:MAG: hypothetical protein RMJ56_18030 [Gemmataceae bacterium]|nr:hypothetical protein [Gemmataceae bacterium]